MKSTLKQTTTKKENTTCQNLWDAEKLVIIGKFLPTNTYVKKIERS